MNAVMTAEKRPAYSKFSLQVREREETYKDKECVDVIPDVLHSVFIDLPDQVVKFRPPRPLRLYSYALDLSPFILRAILCILARNYDYNPTK